MPADVYLKTSNYPAPAWDPAHATISALSMLPTADYLVTVTSWVPAGCRAQKLRQVCWRRPLREGPLPTLPALSFGKSQE